MIALLYLGVLTWFGDSLASRWLTFVSLPHRVATGFLVGLLTGTWLTYLAAAAAGATSDPMAVGGLASTLAMILAATWLRRRPMGRPVNPVRSLRSTRVEWLLGGLVAAAVGAMMIWTFHYDQGSLWIAGDLWSDFGPTSAISQSFALGHNFPTEYPHFAGEPIRYHFLFYFQVGNLTYLGLDPATANNLLSTGSVVALLVVVAALGERLFGSRLAGWIGVALFFFHGALSFIPYLGSFPSIGHAIAALPDLDHFLSSGFPYRGEEWGIWTQDAYLNQRHLPSAIGSLLVIVLFVLQRLPAPAYGPPEPGLRGTWRRFVASFVDGRRRLAEALRRPLAVARATRRDPWLGGYVLCGLLAGLLPMWNSAMFIATAIVLGVLFVVFPNRPQMVVMAIASAVVSVPQMVYLRPGAMAGEQTYPTFYWGYTVENPTPIRVATYLAFIFGPKLILCGLALLLGTWRQARVFLAFAALVAVAFLVQFSLEVFANHKFIHAWLIPANVFAGYALVRIWRARGPLAEPARTLAMALVAIIVAGGVIDLIPIKNERIYQAGVDGDRLSEWVRAETRPDDVFLTDFYVVHGILLSGRKIYLGWPYYAWSAGYDVRAREDWYRELFALRSAREVATRLQAAGIAYVAIDDGLRERGFVPRINEELFRANFESVFDDPEGRYGRMAIYRVPEEPSEASLLPDAPREDMYTGGTGSAPGSFEGPRGLALDRDGNVYVADAGNDRVQQFSSSGNLRDVIADGEVDGPTGVAVTLSGSIVVAAGDRLAIFDVHGFVERELTVDDGMVPGWVDVAVDRDGTIYGLDGANGRIARFAPDGAVGVFGGIGAGDGQFQDPSGIAVRDGTVVVADAGNARIQRLANDGTFVGASPVPEWADGAGADADVAIGDDETVWASSPSTDAILVFRADGTAARTVTPATPETLDRPTGLALRPGGWLFVANGTGNRVSLVGSINP